VWAYATYNGVVYWNLGSNDGPRTSYPTITEIRLGPLQLGVGLRFPIGSLGPTKTVINNDY
jgi:hypothetical protein